MVEQSNEVGTRPNQVSRVIIKISRVNPTNMKLVHTALVCKSKSGIHPKINQNSDEHKAQSLEKKKRMEDAT